MPEPFDPYYRWLGIPPKEQPPHYYRLLAIQLFEGNADVIEAAADQRMAHLRSYQLGKNSELSQKLLNEVSAAKGCLLNTAKKSAYDARLRAKLTPPMVHAEALATERVAEPAIEALWNDLPGQDEDAQRRAASVVARRAGKRNPAKRWIVGGSVLVCAIVLGLFLWAFNSPPRAGEQASGKPSSTTNEKAALPPSTQPIATEQPGKSLETKPSPPSKVDTPLIEPPAVSTPPSNSNVGLAAVAATNDAPAFLGEGKFGRGLKAETGSKEIPRVTASLKLPLPFTIEFWAKVEMQSYHQFLLGSGPDSDTSKRLPTDDQWSLYCHKKTGLFHLFTTAYKPDKVISETLIGDNTWHYLAVTLDGATLNLYVDAKLAATAQLTGVAKTAGQGPLRFAGGDGLIDEVRISKTVRQITAVPTAPFEADDQTIGLWHFDTYTAGRGFPDSSRLANWAVIVGGDQAPQTTALAAAENGSPNSDPPSASPDGAQRSAPEASSKNPPPAATAVAPPKQAGEKKLTVPTAEQQAVVLKQLEEVYSITKARKPAEQQELASRLFETSKKVTDPVEQFVILRKAADLAAESGDATTTLQSIDVMVGVFDLDGPTVKQKMLAKMAAGAIDSPRIDSLVDGTQALVAEAVAENRFEIATAALEVAYGACLRPAGKDHRKQITQQRAEMLRTFGAWKEFQEALTALKAAPDDPARNLTVAGWYCFQQNDWEPGLPYLAKSGNEELRALAKRELDSPPSDAPEQVKLADAWWDLAQSVKDYTKDALLVHTGSWYEQAKTGLPPGLLQQKVEKRLADLEAMTKREATATAASPSRPSKRTGPKIAVSRFDAANADVLATLEGHKGWIYGLAFSPNGRTLISGGSDKSVRFWDVATRQPSGQLPPFTSEVRSLALNRDGSLLAIGLSTGTMSIWDVAKGQVRSTLTGHTRMVRALAFSPDGALLASGGDDNVVKLWSVTTGKTVQTLTGHSAEVTGVAFSPDGLTLASAGAEGPIRLWNPKTGEPRRTVDTTNGNKGPSILAFSLDGSTLVSRGKDDTLAIWSVAKDDLRSTQRQGGKLNCVAIHPDGSLLASGGEDKTVKVWDAATGELLRTFDYGTSVDAVDFSPDGSILVAGGNKMARFYGSPTLQKRPAAKK